MIALWLAAADDLGIRVTAPVELRDKAGAVFACEAFVPDFGSPTGGYVLSRKTERRVRQHLRNTEHEIWWSGGERRQPATYVRSHFIAELVDWGWFGARGDEPAWYRERVPQG
ncbi:MAG: hypothetical protein ACOY5Y_15445 [Pseudomonadota bacterium]